MIRDRKLRMGVISGDISGDDLVKAIDTKADSIRYE